MITSLPRISKAWRIAAVSAAVFLGSTVPASASQPPPKFQWWPSLFHTEAGTVGAYKSPYMDDDHGPFQRFNFPALNGSQPVTRFTPMRLPQPITAGGWVNNTGYPFKPGGASAMRAGTVDAGEVHPGAVYTSEGNYVLNVLGLVCVYVPDPLDEQAPDSVENNGDTVNPVTVLAAGPTAESVDSPVIVDIGNCG